MLDTLLETKEFSSDSNDSEFNSHDEEEELRLYTALYFGERSENNVESQTTEDKILKNPLDSDLNKDSCKFNSAEARKELNTIKENHESSIAKTNSEPSIVVSNSDSRVAKSNQESSVAIASSDSNLPMINSELNNVTINNKPNSVLTVCESNSVLISNDLTYASINSESCNSVTNKEINPAATRNDLNIVKSNGGLNLSVTCNETSNTKTNNESQSAKLKRKKTLKDKKQNNKTQALTVDVDMQHKGSAENSQKNCESIKTPNRMNKQRKKALSPTVKKKNKVKNTTSNEPQDILISNSNCIEKNSLQITSPVDSCNTSDEEESRCNRKVTKKAAQPVNDSYTVSSSDEEVCVLPPPLPKPVEMLTLDSCSESLGSEESITVIEPKEKNLKQIKKRKVVKEVVKSAKTKITKKENIIHLSSSDTSSSSDEGESDFIEAITRPHSSLIMNIRSNASKFTKFSEKTNVNKRRKKVHSTSRVIFSKGRSLTQRTPSCPKWTQEMASFYDSDISDEYLIEDIHAAQTDCSSSWAILSEDYQHRKQTRYFNREVRCVRCKEFGHLVQKCTKVPHCLYCGSSSHTYISSCPNNCCLRCGGATHGYCHLTNNYMICEECGARGHHSSLCPDTWRRFHATTSGSIPLVPKQTSNSLEQTPYCYNCAKKGHYGHECLQTNFKKYLLASTNIYSYDKFEGGAETKKATHSTSSSHPSKSSDSSPSNRKVRRFQENMLNDSRNSSKIYDISEIGSPKKSYEGLLYLNAIAKLKGRKSPKVASHTKEDAMSCHKRTKKKDNSFTSEGSISSPTHKETSDGPTFDSIYKETSEGPTSGNTNVENMTASSEANSCFPRGISSSPSAILGHLPIKRHQALQAVRKLLNHKIPLSVDQVKEYLKYFKKYDKDTSGVQVELYNARLQLLTKHMYLGLKFGVKDKNALYKFKDRLQKSRDVKVEEGLYQKISKIYSKIAFPTKHVLKTLIPLTEDYVQSLEENDKTLPTKLASSRLGKKDTAKLYPGKLMQNEAVKKKKKLKAQKKRRRKFFGKQPHNNWVDGL